MDKINKFQFTVLAISRLRPDARFTLFEDCSLQWDDVNTEQPPSQEEIDAEIAIIKTEAPLKALRQKRDKLIALTDWWVVPDRTPTQEQLDYRQALRDITQTYSSLDDVVWPVKPE